MPARRERGSKIDQSQDRARTEPLSDTGRAEAFSDGVLAVVITLLVLEFGVPESEPGRLLSGLWRQWPLYLATVTSYLYVGVVWTNHKAAFRRIRAMDRGLHWANLGVLFATSLVPFPTAVVAAALRAGNATDERTTVGLYALIGVLLCASWLVFYHYLGRHPDLAEAGVHEEYFPRERTRAWIGCTLYAVAGVAGLFAPPVALVIFFALPVFYGITSEGLFEFAGVRRRR